MSYTYDRTKVARDFPTPEALREYLKDHPDADKSNHHVAPKKDEPAKAKDPREYARERAKHAPPKKNQTFQGVPALHTASERVVARFLSSLG